MGSKLQRNAIISGYINSYCLVCECYFDTDEETSGHIEDKAHKDKLFDHPYLEKYGDNHIRKVNKGYFCEFCSLLLATAAKVSLHVQEKSHSERRGVFLLQRPSGVAAVIAFDDLFIEERAWHSLSEDTCAICNEEFANENLHKTESGHLLKLVQTKVEFGPNNTIYRKTDDSSFQCLTCNSVFELNNLNEHFTDSEHKNLYTKCQEEYKKYIEQSKSKFTEKTVKNEVKNAEPVNLQKSDAKDKKVVVRDDAKDNNVDIKDKKANFKDNVKTVDVKDNVKVDKNHNNIKENESKTTKLDITEREWGCTTIVQKTSTPTQPTEDEATVFANGNNLTYNTGNTNAFCRVCETKLPATLRSMKEHVNGKEHKSRLAKAKQIAQPTNTKARITKKPMRKFIEYCVNVENVFHEDVVINEKYCVPLVSFVMMTKVGARYRCQTCEVTVYEDDIGEHVDSPSHERAMQNTPVITSVPDSEFVREVRPNIYHCGFCNLIVPRWEEVASHLQSREHRDNKDACTWRLQRHLPGIVDLRKRQEMDVLRMLSLGRMFRH